MASLTVRQLDDKLKKLLRLRAARHGRSMEDEVRTILRPAADNTGRDILERFEPRARSATEGHRRPKPAASASCLLSVAALPL